MDDWTECDNMIYNEKTKIVVTWETYGEETEYFLSQEHDYIDDPYEETLLSDTTIIINEEITEENTLESLIKRTKELRC